MTNITSIKCLLLVVATTTASLHVLANTEKKDNDQSSHLNHAEEKKMQKVTQLEKDENLKNLIDENHDLSGLEVKVIRYLSDAEEERQEIHTKITALLGHKNNNVLAELNKEISALSQEMQEIFVTLKNELLEVTGKKTGENEENPMLHIMLTYKKSLFKIKAGIDKTVTELTSTAGLPNSTQFEILLHASLLNAAKIKALSGLAELQNTGVLHKILLKLTFSLASINVKVPFIDWAPKDVVDQFWLYLDIQRKDGLKIPFVEFYKDPTPYVQL